MTVRKSYQNRVVAFIDILGFKNYVEESLKNKERIENIQKCIKALITWNGSSEFSQTFCMTNFSDSFVISYSISEESSIFLLINKIASNIYVYMKYGFLIRGAITVGELIHEKDCVFGPAMNRAYELESNFSKFPRIIIDPDLFNFIKYNHAEHHTEKEELEYINKFLKEDDADGFHFIDYFSFDAVADSMGLEEEGYAIHLCALYEKIKAGIRSSNTKSVLEKYEWMQKKFDLELQEHKNHLRSVKLDSEEFFRHEAFYQTINELNLLKMEALRKRKILNDT